ncbi:hypothetical protein BJY04DRAFT_186348 [Aspergillus karnatakaensis]|uniref:uncharacterized protein n=1 Tax=Aspergillus karnatakaensis TaxID=1810916 RepID=UPI003CCD490A
MIAADFTHPACYSTSLRFSQLIVSTQRTTQVVLLSLLLIPHSWSSVTIGALHFPFSFHFGSSVHLFRVAFIVIVIPHSPVLGASLSGLVCIMGSVGLVVVLSCLVLLSPHCICI